MTNFLSLRERTEVRAKVYDYERDYDYERGGNHA
jgi:hypothetical protein